MNPDASTVRQRFPESKTSAFVIAFRSSGHQAERVRRVGQPRFERVITVTIDRAPTGYADRSNATRAIMRERYNGSTMKR